MFQDPRQSLFFPLRRRTGDTSGRRPLDLPSISRNGTHGSRKQWQDAFG